jgi:hypothetical protein
MPRRKYIVSIASPQGSGRGETVADSPKAAVRSFLRKHKERTIPKNTSMIVTQVVTRDGKLKFDPSLQFSYSNKDFPDSMTRGFMPRKKTNPFLYNAALASAVHLSESELKERILLSRKKIREFKRDPERQPHPRAIAVFETSIRVAEAELKRRKQPRKRPRTFKSRR